MSKKNERVKRLIEILRVRSYVSIKELAKLLNVSEMTVRRDLKILEANNVAENIDGTSVYNPAHLGISGNSYSLSAEVEKRSVEKEAIGRYAASMAEDGDIIIIDTGTTTERIAPNLPADKDITVLCYSINILMELRRNPGVKMIFSGGFYHPNTQMFTCDEAIQFIRGIRAQKLFVSAAGVHGSLGVTCANAHEVPVKKAVLASSVRKILVADSSKFGAVRSSHFCELCELDDIITDGGITGEWRRVIEDAGVELHVV